MVVLDPSRRVLSLARRPAARGGGGRERWRPPARRIRRGVGGPRLAAAAELAAPQAGRLRGQRSGRDRRPGGRPSRADAGRGPAPPGAAGGGARALRAASPPARGAPMGRDLRGRDLHAPPTGGDRLAVPLRGLPRGHRRGARRAPSGRRAGDDGASRPRTRRARSRRLRRRRPPPDPRGRGDGAGPARGEEHLRAAVPDGTLPARAARGVHGDGERHADRALSVGRPPHRPAGPGPAPARGGPARGPGGPGATRAPGRARRARRRRHLSLLVRRRHPVRLDPGGDVEGSGRGGGGRPHGDVLRHASGGRGAPRAGPPGLPGPPAPVRLRAHRRRRRAMKTVGAFLLFLVLAIAWTWPARGWPMVFDDLHLVRTFRGSELAAAWTGPWDPDGLETPGFRPLSLAFNHVRAALFDDRVIGHRHALAAFFALELALLVPLGRYLDLGAGASIAAGLVMLFTRYSAYHLVWITDGNHHLQGLAFMGSALLLVQALERTSRALLAASLLAIALGLCVREDTLAALPALALIAFALGPRRLAAAYTIGLGTLGVGMLAWRRAFVPAAQPLGLDFAGFARAVAHAFDPVGVGGFDFASRVLSHGGWALLALTIAALVATRDRAAWSWAARWALAAVASCTPGLLLQPDDLPVFASLFVALILATPGQALWP